jgi:acetolactate synthase-1/2/3 large subunit
MPTGAELFVDAALRLGIDRIFTLVGDHLNEVLTEAARRGMVIVDMRHESGVTHAADAWARIHLKPALSLVTGGPGHTNSLTGVATANLNGTPLIAVSGATSTAMKGRVVFQEIDQVAMTAPGVKWSAQPANTAQIPYVLGRAYAEATAGRMGAVHLTIPVDLFAGATDSPVAMPIPPPSSEAAPASGDVERALALLRKAERPVVIAGSGLWWSQADGELAAFLRKTRIPYYSITMARGVIPDDFPLGRGYADPALNKATHTIFREADVVLVLGKRIDYRLALGGPRLFSPATKFIQVDIHGQELGVNRALEVGIRADLKATLRAMLEVLGKESWKASPWLRRTREAQQLYTRQLDALADERSKDSLIHPASLFAELRGSLPKDTYISWDGGDFVHWGRAMLPALVPGGWLRLGPMGTIGSALPISVALQMAHPGAPVLMVTGDGSLGFYLAELDTMVRYGLPVVMVVGNDGGWGVERELQLALCGPKTVACELRRTRYDRIMRGFGGAGENITRLDQVAPAVRRAFSSGKPYLLNAQIRGVRSSFTEWQISGKSPKPSASATAGGTQSR